MIKEFLFDEQLPTTWRKALRRRGMTEHIRHVGDPGAPPKGTPDPDILKWCEEHHAALITNNRTSMPGHLVDHVAAGGHVPGIFIVNTKRISLDNLALDLSMLYHRA